MFKASLNIFNQKKKKASLNTIQQKKKVSLNTVFICNSTKDLVCSIRHEANCRYASFVSYWEKLLSWNGIHFERICGKNIKHLAPTIKKQIYLKKKTENGFHAAWVLVPYRPRKLIRENIKKVLSYRQLYNQNKKPSKLI